MALGAGELCPDCLGSRPSFGHTSHLGLSNPFIFLRTSNHSSKKWGGDNPICAVLIGLLWGSREMEQVNFLSRHYPRKSLLIVSICSFCFQTSHSCIFIFSAITNRWKIFVSIGKSPETIGKLLMLILSLLAAILPVTIGKVTYFSFY